MALACGTIKPGTTKISLNGFNIQNHHLHGNCLEQQQIISQINNNTSSVSAISNNNDCILVRHTVAGLPLLANNNNEISHKARPALSIHTFDPPEQLIDHKNIMKQNSPAIYTPLSINKENIECK